MRPVCSACEFVHPVRGVAAAAAVERHEKFMNGLHLSLIIYFKHQEAAMTSADSSDDTRPAALWSQTQYRGGA